MSQQLKSFQTKISKFPIHPQRAYNKYLAEPIDDLVQSYHCAQWIQLEDNIHFHDHQEYLKRFYKHYEFKNKIKLLGEYYRYHFQSPRIYMEDIGRIIQTNVQQKRALEFAIVTKEMQAQDSQAATPMNSHRDTQQHQRLIKDVELSYEDFEAKPTKKQKVIIQIDKQVNQTTKGSQQLKFQNQRVHRTMNRVDSIHCKGSFLVFKPKNQVNKKNEPDKKSKVQAKYKKPKHQIKNKKTQISKKSDGTKSKIISKINSTNNSLASHQGLSRSKSKAQLHVITNKKFELKNDNLQKLQIQNKNKQIRSNNSQQNSLVKSLSKKQILGDSKGQSNGLSRKASKVDLRQDQKLSNKNSSLKTQRHKILNLQTNNKLQRSSDQQNEKNVKSYAISRKPSCGNIQTQQPKKMFTRAIQIKKKNK